MLVGVVMHANSSPGVDPGTLLMWSLSYGFPRRTPMFGHKHLHVRQHIPTHPNRNESRLAFVVVLFPNMLVRPYSEPCDNFQAQLDVSRGLTNNYSSQRDGLETGIWASPVMSP